jgi:hypothetical protein
MIERREREGERETERYKERYREGGRDKRERERVNPTLCLMSSQNYGTHACKKRRGTCTVHSLRGNSWGIMTGNYPWIIV